MRRWVIPCLALGWSAACQTTGDFYQTALSSWQGASETELLSKWGSPSSTDELSDGRRILHYLENVAVSASTSDQEIPRQTTFEAGLYDRFRPLDRRGIDNNYDSTLAALRSPARGREVCDTRFTISANGAVESADHEGAGCVALPLKLRTS